MRRHRTLILAALIVAAATALVLWRRLGPLEVEAAQPTRGPAVEAVYATGLVEPTLEIRIAPRVAARIAELRVDEGDEVKKGELLARLEDADLRASVRELEARVEYARAQHERNIELRRSALVSQDTVDRSQTELEAARATLKRAREQVSFMRLEAPADGRIIRRDGEVGEFIPANETIFYMSGPAPLRIEADVDEEDVPRVKPGLRVVIRSDAFPDRLFEGTVDQVTPRGDPVSRSYRVRIGLVDNPPLQIGMTAETNIILAERQNAVLVPSSSVVDGSVWIVNDAHAQHTKVHVGVVGPEKTEILEGLKDTDWIIVRPPEDLQDGKRVKAKPLAHTEPSSPPAPVSPPVS